MDALLEKVKQNLILDHAADDPQPVASFPASSWPCGMDSPIDALLPYRNINGR